MKMDDTNHTVSNASVPGIFNAAQKYTGGRVWHTYDMPNYTPMVCQNFKFDTYKFA